MSAHYQTPPTPRRTLRARSDDGTRIHVRIHGPADGPTVVLCHGWTASALFWAPVIRQLADDFQVIAYDQRGHGHSDLPGKGGYTTTALADDLCAVLRACLAADEPTVLAGHSMGGMTIMAAAERPEIRTHAVAALLASTGSAALARDARVVPATGRLAWLGTACHRALLTARLPLGPVTPVSRRLLRYATMGAGARAEDVDFCARITHACRTTVRAGWGRVLAELDLDESVRALDVPTLLLVGSADRLTPPAHAHRLARLLPRCEDLIELPGLGHMTPVEDPDAINEAVRRLAREHPRTTPAS